MTFRTFFCIFLSFIFLASPSFAQPELQSSHLRLWFKHPAKNWTEALPVGNGRLGAMIFGRIENERIQLNEETIWTGHPVDRYNPEAKKYLKKVRRLLFAGKYFEAQKLAQKKIMGKRLETGVHTYQTLGDLHLQFVGQKDARDYERELDLSRAIVRVKYRVGKAHFEREIFSSAVDQAIVMKISCDQPERLSFDVALSRPGDKSRVTVSPGRITMKEHVGNGDGVRFETQLKLINNGGSVTEKANGLRVEKANSVVLLLVAGTDYRGDDPHELCQRYFALSENKSFKNIRAAHVADYQHLFNRVHLDLGTTDASYFATDERLDAMKRGSEDPNLIALYFQFGRYLLISSSRPGCLPANLQGIWADGLKPPWNADYHININIQMNYWPAEETNLSECHEPFLKFIDALRPRGRETAKKVYGCKGFVAHHTTDVWHFTAPIGKVGYGLWPQGAAWACRHLWEHYLYTQDNKFLREKAYPIMKEAAQFFEDYLVKNPNTGYLVSGPSISPENKFLTKDGVRASICMGPTMDQQIVSDLFTNCINAAKILGKDKEFRQKLFQMKRQLAPMKIGHDGRLMEWPEEFKEPEPGHRHISHLFGLYPGNLISYQKSPELMAAARKTIDYRLAHGGGHTGWSRAWIINFFARMQDGEKAYENVLALLRKSTLSNMFDNHPPFQIDGNFGGTAGISEMLLQSHAGEIQLLPALPQAWKNGQVKGLVARGGFVVDIFWQDGKLAGTKIYSKFGKPCKIRYGKKVISLETRKNTSYELNNNLVLM